MEKDVNQRVASAQELLDAMRRLFSADQQPSSSTASQEQSDGATIVSANPTAALPKPKKLPYVLAAILLLQVIGIGGVFYYQSFQEQKAQTNLRNQAKEDLQRAATAYQAGNYDIAKQLYTKVANEWPNDRLFTPASQAGILLAQAKLA